jgi:hypothetical protein
VSDDLDDRLRRLSGSVSAAEERLDIAEAALAEAKSESETLGGRVDTLADRAADRDDVVELTARFDALEETVGELDASMTSMKSTLTGVRQSLQHMATSGPAAAGGGEDEDGPRFEAWLAADEARAPQYILEVMDWVKTVAVTLDPRLEILCRCWLNHPVVVQALHDARTAWYLVYSSDSIHDLASWYKLWPDLVKVIEKDLRSCTGLDTKTEEPKEHRPPMLARSDDKSKWNIFDQNLLELEQPAQSFAARTIGRPARLAPAAAAAEEDQEQDEDETDVEDDET